MIFKNQEYDGNLKKRILFYSLTLNAGGAERVISNLANYFSEKFSVSISLLTNSDVSYKLNKDVVVNLPKSKYNKTGLFYRIKNIFNLIKYTYKYKPDYIIAFCPTMCFIACFLKIIDLKFKKIKLIISERNDPNAEYKTKFVKNIANFLYRQADIIVFQTEDAKMFFNLPVQKKGVIIPNPINERFLNNSIINKKEKSIVTVGRLVEQKNQKLLIKACSSIFEKYDDYILKIYGDGPLKEELINYSKFCGIENKVKFMGISNNLEKELPNNSIFVLPSNYEGMPNSLMEAMAVGLPCISTDCPCGGPNMLIKHGYNGFLIPVNDVKSLISSLDLLISDENIREEISNNALLIKDSLSPNVIYSKWDVLLDEKRCF